jgi:hypothetical protein
MATDPTDSTDSTELAGQVKLAELMEGIESFIVTLKKLGEVRTEHLRLYGYARTRAEFAQLDRKLEELRRAARIW